MAVPEKLYKYYSFDSNGYWRAPFKDKYLYFNTYENFNDPYEFYFKTNSEGSFEEKIKHLKDANPGNEFIASLDTIDKLDDYIRKLKTNNIWGTLKPLFQHFGISCFSRTPDIMLMWSHYTRSHSGFCLEFDVKALNECAQSEDKINWVEVDYVEQVPEYSIFKAPKYSEIVGKKSKDWEYESEVRALRLPTNYHFPAEVITGIIFGLNGINQPEDSPAKKYIEELKSYLNKDFTHLQDSIFLAKKDISTYKINIERLSWEFLY